MMKVRNIEFEGTAEEFVTVAHLFGNQSSAASESIKGIKAGVSDGASTNVAAEVKLEHVERVLTRLHLSRSMRGVLKALLSSRTGLTTTEIAKAVGITNAELAGVFGAFGRRVANTPGWPQGVSFITYTRDEDDRDWLLSLPDVARDVLESGRVKL